MSGPFSTNLRRLYRRRSDGGAGDDHAQEMLACENTDREIWRREPGDYYSPSIHVTKEGAIGINVGGTVIVMDVEDWHLAGTKRPKPRGRDCLASVVPGASCQFPKCDC